MILDTVHTSSFFEMSIFGKISCELSLYLWKVSKFIDLIPPRDFSIQILLVSLLDQVLVLHQRILPPQLLLRVNDWVQVELLLKLILIEVIKRIKVELGSKCHQEDTREHQIAPHVAGKMCIVS